MRVVVVIGLIVGFALWASLDRLDLKTERTNAAFDRLDASLERVWEVK